MQARAEFGDDADEGAAAGGAAAGEDETQVIL